MTYAARAAIIAPMMLLALAFWLAEGVAVSPLVATDEAVQLDHFRAFVDGVANSRWGAVARYIPTQFPIGIEDGDKRTRKTYEPAQVLAGTVPFPSCDPKVDQLSCATPRDSGRVTCTCVAGTRTVEVDFQNVGQTPHLISIREKR